MSDLAAIELRLAELERQVEAADERKALRDLKARYILACDPTADADAVANLFVEEGSWSGPFGRHDGRRAIHAFMTSVSKTVLWSFHQLAPMRLELEPNGDRATGHWYATIFIALADEAADAPTKSVVLIGSYYDTFVRRNGTWHLEHLAFHTERLADIKDGWAAPPPSI